MVRQAKFFKQNDSTRTRTGYPTEDRGRGHAKGDSNGKGRKGYAEGKTIKSHGEKERHHGYDEESSHYDMNRNKRGQKGAWEHSPGPAGKPAHQGERRGPMGHASASRSSPRRRTNYSPQRRTPSGNSWSSHERSRPSSYVEMEHDSDKYEGRKRHHQGGRERDISASRRRSRYENRDKATTSRNRHGSSSPSHQRKHTPRATKDTRKEIHQADIKHKLDESTEEKHSIKPEIESGSKSTLKVEDERRPKQTENDRAISGILNGNDFGVLLQSITQRRDGFIQEQIAQGFQKQQPIDQIKRSGADEREDEHVKSQPHTTCDKQ